MPCPPSWEERQLLALDGDIADLRAKIARDRPAIEGSLALVDALLALRPERHASVEDLSACSAWARALPSEIRYAGPVANVSGRWPEPADVALTEAERAFYADAAARLALCLCVFGTFVALFARDAGVPGEHAAAIERELARHLAHRERDREEKLATIALELRSLVARERRGPLDAWHASRREALRAETERIRALDAATITTDRCAF